MFTHLPSSIVMLAQFKHFSMYAHTKLRGGIFYSFKLDAPRPAAPQNRHSRRLRPIRSRPISQARRLYETPHVISRNLAFISTLIAPSAARKRKSVGASRWSPQPPAFVTPSKYALLIYQPQRQIHVLPPLATKIPKGCSHIRAPRHRDVGINFSLRLLPHRLD